MHTSMQYLIKMAGRNSYTLLLLVICAALCIETSESITEQENEYINLAGEEHEAGREKREINLDENILESDLAIFDEAADVEKRDTMLKIDARNGVTCCGRRAWQRHRETTSSHWSYRPHRPHTRAYHTPSPTCYNQQAKASPFRLHHQGRSGSGL